MCGISPTNACRFLPLDLGGDLQLIYFGRCLRLAEMLSRFGCRVVAGCATLGPSQV
jgi:hypothetical protein